MREDRSNRDRVSRRSSTGIRKETPERERRQRIRMFEDADDLYGEDTRERRERDSYEDRRRRDDDRDDYRRGRSRDEDRYRDRDDRYRDRDDRYRDRDDRYRDRDDRYRDRDDRYRDREDRRREEDDRDRYEDRRRDDRYREERRDSRYEESRRERREPQRRQAGGSRKRTGSGVNTDSFAHQIIPYVMFWVALFGAVSLVMRDLLGADGGAGAFGSWFADFLCGLLGPIAYALPVFLVVIALRWKRFVRENLLAKKILLSIAFLVLLSAIVHVFMERETRAVIDVNSAVLYTAGMNMTGGGFFGGFVGEYLGYVLRAWGTGLLGIPLLLVIGIYLIGLTPGGLWQRISAKLKQVSDNRRERDRARYNGEEERKLHNSRRKEGVVKYEEKKKPRVERPAPEEKEPLHYEFREEEDEIETEIPRAEQPEASKKAEAPKETVEMVDIPDDEPEEIPTAAGNAVLRRVGGMQDSEQTLQDILAEIGKAADEPKPTESSVKAEPAAPAQEERPLQGNYYSPFSLTHRKKLHEDGEIKQENRIVIDPASSSAKPAEAPSRAEETLGNAEPRDKVESYYENGVLTERHAATTIYKKDPVQRPVEAPVTPAEPIAAKEPVSVEKPASKVSFDAADDILSGMTFADDEPVGDTEPLAESRPATVPFERERLTPDYTAPAAKEEPAAQPVIIEDSAPEAPDAEEELDDEIVTTPAIGVRTDFALPGEEPAKSASKEEPVREQPAAPMQRPVKQIPTRVEPVKSEPAPTPEPPPAPREYRLPPISLLNEDKAIKDDDHSEENQQKIDILRRTLESFNVRIKDEVVCSRGPTITRYEVRPEIGVSVRSIMNRIDDISLYMEAQVRIAPIQGKAAVGVEVPNKVRETVYLRTLLESEPFKRSKNPVEVALGVGIGGDIQMCDLTAMPHLLVAGATKSGKSVCINTIILSLLYKTSPKDLRLILIDPKRVEFKPYMHLPHLYAPIITEPAHAVGALACAVREMERRYTLLEDVGARNFEAYNEKVKNDPDREHLPYLVIIIDEYYDLKMACPNNDLENFACRLAQKARAAGIHLIIGTQRPSVNVITGTLKANIPSRIAFTVMQQVDSRTILDAVGAELLTGRGDMLYAPMGEKPIRLQGSFVSDDEVESVVTFVRDRNDPVRYNQAFMEQIEIEVARAANADKKNDDFDDLSEDGDGDVDPKFYDAVVLAVQTQKVATSLLQRRLGVGYGRAAKIIDRMEELGLVTPAEGNKPRKLLPAAQGYLDHVANLDFEGDGDDFGADGNY